jgi:hypothetical protein
MREAPAPPDAETRKHCNENAQEKWDDYEWPKELVKDRLIRNTGSCKVDAVDSPDHVHLIVDSL